MTAVSSTLTLFFKLVLPTMWITFFTGLTVAMFTLDITYVGPFTIEGFRMGLLAFLLTGIAFLYWSVLRIKRVDMDNEFFYVTNYFKTYRYPFHQIQKLNERDYKLFRVFDIYLKEPGSFGKKITFIAHRYRFDQFVQSHPVAFQGLLEEKMS
ncbi:MAG: hypothetical protein AAFV95_26365 [Bacteroidota bacterium]